MDNERESYARSWGVFAGVAFGCFLLNAGIFIAYWQLVSFIGVAVSVGVMIYAMWQRDKYVRRN